MNINCKMSGIIRKIEKRMKTNNITNSKYLVIKRDCKNSPLGLFAYYITNVGWIEYAIRNNMIPVIDMKNYYNSFHESGEVGKINTWELFFEQPGEISLERALVSKKARYVWKDIPEYQPNESLDFLMNPIIVQHYRNIIKKYVRFKPEIIEQLQAESDRLLNKSVNNKILGVLIRGTDYVELRPHYHPIQPNVDQVVEKINLYRNEYKCNKIYVATEDAYILEKMKDIYGEDLLFTNQKRVCGTGKYLNDDLEFNKRNPFERGIEYLQSIYTLSQCSGIIAGRCSGTVGAILLAQDYEFQYIFSLGRYGVEDKMIDE